MQDDNYDYGAKKRKIAITLILYLLMSIYAVSVTMLGPLIPHLVDYYTVSLSSGGLIVSFQNVGSILSLIFGAILVKKIKKPVLIMIAFAVYTATLFYISSSPVFHTILFVFFLLGSGTRILDLVANVFIVDLHPQKKGLFLTLLHGCFALGALTGPLFSHSLLNKGIKWNQTFFILGLLCLLVLILYLIIIKLYHRESSEITYKPSYNFKSVIRNPKMWILSLIMVMYSAHQTGVNTWWFYYMKNIAGASEFLSSFSLTLFWMGIIVGRFFSSYIILFVPLKSIILYGNLLGGIILTTGILINDPVILVISVALAGFLTGAVIPLLITLACNHHPDNSTAATAMVYLFNALSNMFFPWFIGLLLDSHNQIPGIAITGISLIIAFFISLFLINPDPRVS